jgi:deazaflavin-dependent oxidoreductase (nitroreductase family)
VSDFNQQIIDEFHENQGVVGGPFEGASITLLHTIGAKSGRERVYPVMYQSVEGGIAVFASKAGAPTNPDWYHNVKANPSFDVEVGAEQFGVHAREATGEERETIWEKQKADYPQFAEYEASTDRRIPVLVLERT